MRNIFIGILLTLSPAIALASDYTGLGTIIIGLPIAIIAFLINFIIKVNGSVSHFSYRLSGIATTATVLVTLLVSGDAISIFQTHRADVLDKLSAIILFALTGTSAFTFTRILAAKESLERSRKNVA